MYFMEFKTDINIGTREFVTDLLTSWYNHENELLRPEFYGMGEPVRYRIAERSIDAAIETWLKKRMPVMLRRSARPRFSVDMDWGGKSNNIESRDPRRYPSDCAIWLNSKATDGLAIELFRFLLSKFNPGFALLTTENDHKVKHRIEYKEGVYSVSQYIGREFDGKCLPGDVAETLPGVYWLTYMGEWAIEQIGREKFANLPVHKVEECHNGILMMLYDKSKLIGTPKAQEIEQSVRRQLGEDLFFDIKRVDIPNYPAWQAEWKRRKEIASKSN